MMDSEERMYYEMITGEEYQDPHSNAHGAVFQFLLTATVVAFFTGLAVAISLYLA